MSISNTTVQTKVSGDGVTATFSFGFKIYADADLAVYFENKATGVLGTVKTLAVDYTVSRSTTGEGGTITILTTVPAGTEWCLMQSNLDATQPTSFPIDSRLREEDIETMGDRIIRILQQVLNTADRGIHWAINETTASAVLPTPSEGYLRYNGTNWVFTTATTSTDYAGSISTGVDASKSASPGQGDIYYATDTKTTYICYVAGTWQEERISQVGNLAGDTYLSCSADDIIRAYIADNLLVALSAGSLTLATALSGTSIQLTSGNSINGFLNDSIMAANSSGAGVTQAAVRGYVALNGGNVVKIVNSQTGVSSTGATQLPADDTIPQNTEGDQYMSLAITPTKASNKLKIDIVWYGASDTTGEMVLALFQDATASALAAISEYDNIADATRSMSMTHYMTAGTTSETTFKVRAGTNGAGTTTFNGQSAGRLLGGVAASSITITELGV